MRFVSAQFDALLTDDLWMRNARHANAMAARLAAAVDDLPDVEVIRAPQANSILARLPRARIAPLQEWSFFWVWDDEDNVVRWMTSFATTEEDVSRFAEGLRKSTLSSHNVTAHTREREDPFGREAGSKASPTRQAGGARTREGDAHR
jgi:threonine aldolase